MRSRHSLAVGLATVLATLVSQQSPAVAQAAFNPAEENAINPPVANCNMETDTVEESGVFKPTEITKKLVQSGLQPCHQRVSPKGLIGDNELANLQRGFDFYSWLTFLAMNAPADGSPIGSGKLPGGDAKTRWEDLSNYRPLADVMLKDGKEPVWGTRNVPEPCRKFKDTGQIIFQLGEEAFNQPFKTGPLIDQDGNYALFDILMNKPMFEYIVKKQLYNRQGQEVFDKEVVFPIGKNANMDKDDPEARMGAIMLKVSYRILDREKNKDIINQFHTRDALIYFPGGKAATGGGTMAGPACVEKTLGLIGFHVGHKTFFAPQWVWTSFEHVSNVPNEEDVGTPNLLPRYSFFNAKCSEKDCPRNEIPTKPWDPPLSLQYPTSFRSQVVRVNMLPSAVRKEVDSLNEEFHKRLTGTVWKNYVLLATQWPSDAASKTDPNGAPAPIYLANSTLETFSQGKVPLASSSCMACHGNAVSFQSGRSRAIKDGKGFNQSDFTFILEKAQKAP
jgi:hypothetical protein